MQGEQVRLKGGPLGKESSTRPLILSTFGSLDAVRGKKPTREQVKTLLWNLECTTSQLALYWYVRR